MNSHAILGPTVAPVARTGRRRSARSAKVIRGARAALELSRSRALRGFDIRRRRGGRQEAARAGRIATGVPDAREYPALDADGVRRRRPLFFAIVDRSTGRPVGVSKLPQYRRPWARSVSTSTPAQPAAQHCRHRAMFCSEVRLLRARLSALRMECDARSTNRHALRLAPGASLAERDLPAGDRVPRAAIRLPLVRGHRQRVARARGGVLHLACSGQLRRRGPAALSTERAHRTDSQTAGLVPPENQT